MKSRFDDSLDVSDESQGTDKGECHDLRLRIDRLEPACRGEQRRILCDDVVHKA